MNAQYAHQFCKSDERLIFSTITRFYGKRLTVFAVALAAGDSVKYQWLVYGSFVREIQVRYNKRIYQECEGHRLASIFLYWPRSYMSITPGSANFKILIKKNQQQSKQKNVLKMCEIIRIYHKCEGRLEKSLQRITVWHNKIKTVLRDGFSILPSHE